MAVKDILKLGDPRLYAQSEPVSEAEWKTINGIVEDLHDTMLDFRNRYHAGRAIAAPQIGVMKRLIYLNMGKPEILVNPVLTFPEEETMEVWDDCMSFPELLVKVNRFKRCILQYQDAEGKQQMRHFEGDMAELIQHEYDHLDGILAVDRAIDSHAFALKQAVNTVPKQQG